MEKMNLKEVSKPGFLLSKVCLNDEILKNNATDDMDNYWISIQCYYQAIPLKYWLITVSYGYPKVSHYHGNGTAI